jgi:hypothetical protein
MEKRRDVCRVFLWGNLSEIDHLENPGGLD